MSETITDPLEYYARPGLITNPGKYAGLLDGLPTDIPSLCKVVQGLVLHIFWAERYGVKLTAERQQEVQLRHAPRMLARIQELDDRPLAFPRLPEKRLVGNCRDFTVLLCTILRHQGRTARARCGFGAYFQPGHFEDHWVCEYWKASEARWVKVDAQLDELQRKHLRIWFDPTDVPPDQFLPGGKAWQVCRAGQVDPSFFGIHDMRGPGFVQSDLVRDMAAINKVELLPWDCWGLGDVDDKHQASAEDAAVLDRAAAMTLADNSAFAEMRAMYENDERLRVPPVIKSYTDAGPQTVKVGG
jgi:hypothetical protein